jgi:hypothetical protein
MGQRAPLPETVLSARISEPRPEFNGSGRPVCSRLRAASARLGQVLEKRQRCGVVMRPQSRRPIRTQS